MDPDEALRQARDAAQRIQDGDEEAVWDLHEAFTALDGWLSRGGFLPADWAKNRQP